MHRGNYLLKKKNELTYNSIELLHVARQKDCALYIVILYIRIQSYSPRFFSSTNDERMNSYECEQIIKRSTKN